MRSAVPLLLLLASLFGLGACGGTDLGTTGKLSVELIGDGGGQVTAPGISCPDNCESEIEFTQAQVSTIITSQIEIDAAVVADSDSEFLWWLVYSADSISDTPAENCGSNNSCRVIMKSICGVAMLPPLCSANGINGIEMRALLVEQDSLIDWEQGGGDVCVLRKNGEAQCWEDTKENYRDFERTAPPAFVDPIGISVFGDYACVLDQAGVHCWGDSEVVREPGANFGLQNIEGVEVIRGAGCALAATGVTCWLGLVNSIYAGLLDVPPLTTPTNMRREGGQVCVDDASEKVCWYWISFAEAPQVTRTPI